MRPNDAPAGVTRDGDTLVFSGVLSRDAVASLWPRALAQVAGVRRFSLDAVPSVDSAGLALLAELASRAGGGITVAGAPRGLAELRSAYRLDAALAFAAA
ncbi:STAS domain-containing protein [Lysobacter sp. KIS68-7]|uniref:STAS domain-containing protein n=1 Tax=Lysobacter sp. KIS68-7 TaxID=2904252 RepID=UPI001E579144|nr:STAS domain-containing protein [Lysobacter sp. KIS68-7]UHQ20478.1 STAS domain-containing protein [Lysobacter sp. KIS68-7]